MQSLLLTILWFEGKNVVVLIQYVKCLIYPFLFYMRINSAAMICCVFSVFH